MPPRTPPKNHPIDDWRDAEMNAAAWMRYWDYADAKASPGGSDGGVDVRASKAVGQVKFQGAPVGRPVLQRLVGARGKATQDLLFFTGSNYARPAVEYAEAMDMALFTYDPWGRMQPVTSRARAIVAAATRAERKDRVQAGSPKAADKSKPYDGSQPLDRGRVDLGMGLFFGILPLSWLGNTDPVGVAEVMLGALSLFAGYYGVAEWRRIPTREGGSRHAASIARRAAWQQVNALPRLFAEPPGASKRKTEHDSHP